jgi:uncharacterized membrane protein
MKRFKLSAGNTILGIICMLDLVSTVYLLCTGRMVEGNPIMAYVLGYGMAAFILVKLLSFVPTMYLLQWYRSRNLGFSKLMTTVAITGYLCFYILGVLAINK